MGELDGTVETKTKSDFSVRGYPSLYLLKAGSTSANDAVKHSGSRDPKDLASWAL